jgi:hypothetical protein
MVQSGDCLSSPRQDRGVAYPFSSRQRGITKEGAMSTSTFDEFTRRAAGTVSRRASLMTLGGAALAAASAKPSITEAKKNKNKNKKAKKQAKKKCKQQVPQCETALAQVGSPQFSFCCQFLGSCNATQFIQCIAN